MFIWEWVLIALGWLVFLLIFLMVVAFCLSLARSLIEEFSNRK
nr:MAG TPA: rich Proline-rich [Caudoviricetes sp.]